MVYLRCRNCGSYRIHSEIVEEGYCSADCAEQYRTCANCGGYYPADMGYREQYCCPECAVQYKINRRPGTAAQQSLFKELA
jgi:hypothetical protein